VAWRAVVGVWCGGGRRVARRGSSGGDGAAGDRRCDRRGRRVAQGRKRARAARKNFKW
jgi:hypothetical protein